MQAWTGGQEHLAHSSAWNLNHLLIWVVILPGTALAHLRLSQRKEDMMKIIPLQC